MIMLQAEGAEAGGAAGPGAGAAGQVRMLLLLLDCTPGFSADPSYCCCRQRELRLGVMSFPV